MTKEKKNEIFIAFKATFPYTVPMFAGIWFLGITYGIYMHVLGFNFLYPMFMSMLIFAGSMEFITATLLLGAFEPFHAFLLTLMVNARHLFYGISMLDKYGAVKGWKKYFLIFTMCDEIFSINYSADIPKDVNKDWFMVFVGLLIYLYWVTGATIGALFSSLLTFNTEGLEFVMTAMFAVIFLEQWIKENDHTSSLVGLALSALCLIIFGADGFILPTMVSILVVLTILRPFLEKRGESR